VKIGRVVGVGEAMVRLTPTSRARLEQAQELRVSVGGAELNALILLSRLGVDTLWVTRLPANPLGRLIAAHARSHGVSLHVEWDADARAGLYFVETGAAPRPTEVVYDRSNSAASRLEPGRVDWPRLLDGASCLHVSGITPALGPGPYEVVREAMEAARAGGAVTSLDVNYRSRLWSIEDARAAYLELLPLTDVLFATRFDLEVLLDSGGPPVEAAQRVRERDGVRVVVVPDRRDPGPSRSEVTVMAVADETAESGCHEAEVVDPLGAGDAIAAAFLSVHLRGGPLGEAVEAAARAGALKHTIEGDVLLVERKELSPAIGSGRRILR
jgi:2-dehydro-3-deoxygluconokinase